MQSSNKDSSTRHKGDATYDEVWREENEVCHVPLLPQLSGDTTARSVSHAAMASSTAPARYHLTYFACRGRGEAVRLCLQAVSAAEPDGFAWAETRVNNPITDELADAWRALKARRDTTGPIGTLPLLRRADSDGVPLAHDGAGAVEVSQVVALCAFADGMLCKARGLTPDPVAAAQAMMLASAAYLDLCAPMGQLCWAPKRMPEKDPVKLVEAMHATLVGHFLPRLDAMLEGGADVDDGGDAAADAAGECYFFGRGTPSIGDICIFEAVHRLACLVGADDDGFSGAVCPLESEHPPETGGPPAPLVPKYDAVPIPPHLKRHAERMSEVPAIHTYIESGRMASRISGSPDEPAMIALLRATWPKLRDAS